MLSVEVEFYLGFVSKVRGSVGLLVCVSVGEDGVVVAVAGTVVMF